MATRPLFAPQPSNGEERRRFPRYSRALDVAFGSVGSTGALPIAAQLERTVTVNISLGGLCLYSDILYPIGTPLVCMVSVPGHAQPLTILGVLAWFQKVKQDAHGYKLGIEFSALSDADRAALRALFDQPPLASAARAKTLLLVEDDEELRLALQLRFEAAGFRIITAATGLEALHKARAEGPDLMLLDLMLPQLNGYEVCRLLKFDQKFHHIPIVLCTARCRREDRDMGLAAGADAYVTKPFSGEDLIDTVDALLGVPRR